MSAAFGLFTFIGIITTTCASISQYYINEAKDPSDLSKIVVTVLLSLGVSLITASLVMIWYNLRKTYPTYDGSAVWSTFIIIYSIIILILGTLLLIEAKGELSNLVGPGVVILLMGVLMLFGGGAQAVKGVSFG